MVVCQVNREQELLTAQYVAKTLGLLKTRMESLVAKSSYRNTAQKSVGQDELLGTSSVDTAIKRSRPLQARTNSIVMWSVEIMVTSTRLVSKLVRGRATKHHIQRYINGFTHTIKNQIYATTVKGRVTLSGLIYHKSTTEKEMIGLIYARAVISILMVMTSRLLAGSDVIRKRYHKFVTGSEGGWENGTPAIV